jgi:trans-aconitate methyltransferase
LTALHWDAAYLLGDATRSWFQQQPLPSLRALDDAGVTPADSVLDVGGGASPLVDALLARGHDDLSVLDVSAEGLAVAQRRLGDDAARVDWITADLLAWRPDRAWNVWHDRALLHFFVAAGDRAAYLDVLDRATGPGSVAVLATFAPDGPDHCSGLPVSRYGAADLAALLGDRWQLIDSRREDHTTPGGGIQQFTWSSFRRGQ